MCRLFLPATKLNCPRRLDAPAKPDDCCAHPSVSLRAYLPKWHAAWLAVTNRGNRDAANLLKTEDWWAVWIGFLIIGLALVGIQGPHLLGWGVSASEWLDASKAIGPSAKAAYPNLLGWASLGATYLFLLIVMCVGAAAMGWNVPKFAGSFTVIFVVSYACVFIGHYAHIAATPDKMVSPGASPVPASLKVPDPMVARSSPARRVTSSQPDRRARPSATSSRRSAHALVAGGSL